MEIYHEVKVFEVKMQCEKCNGEMEQSGNILLTNPPLYPHNCNKCGYAENYRIQYPNIAYKRIEEGIL